MHALWKLLFWGWTVSEIVIAVVMRTSSRGGDVQDRGTQLIMWLVTISSITANEFVRATVSAPMIGGAISVLRVAILLMIAGLAIRWAAIANLGKAFSVNVAIRDSQTLQNTGMYRLVRHPSYSGLLLIFVAIGLFSLNWISFCVAVLPTTAALLYRIRVEETALRDAFGSQYAAYSAATKRLIPGVY